MRNALTITGGIGIFAACVAAAGMLTQSINQQRKDNNLAVSDNIYDLPPEHAVTQAGLGIFRGIALAFAWQRMEDLKNEGNYSEAVQLGEWITKLQPKFARVWEFVSWNQAYNISVGTHTPDERWFWVRSGIDLLQRKGGGIDSNPDNLRLYQQLAWIYHHKVGMFQDQYNWYYKRNVASEFNAILGEPPRNRQLNVAWLEAIAASPDSEQLLGDEARRLLRYMRDKTAGDVVDQLRDFTVASVLVPIETPEGQEDSAFTAGELEPPQAFPEWAEQETIDETIAFLRKKALKSDRLNMDLDAMIRDADELGAIDWRHPAAHSIYWARRGLERVEEDEGRSLEGQTNLRRQVLNSLNGLAREGRVVYDPLQNYVSYTPDWPFWLDFERYYVMVQDAELEAARAAGVEPGELETLRTERMYGSGFRNRMDAAIADAELYGDRDMADELFLRMARRYEGTRFEERYNVGLDEFLEKQWNDTIENPDTARATISAMLVQALSSLYLVRQPERYDQLVAKALDLHEGWRKLNPDPNDPLYQEVPPFPSLIAEAYGNFLTGKSGQVVVERIPLEIRAGVWASLGDSEDVQVALFRSNFGQEMYRQAAAEGYDPSLVFPPPPSLRFTDELKKSVSGDKDLNRELEEGTDLAEQEIK